MTDASMSLDVTTAAIMIAIPALALLSIGLPVAVSQWRSKRRNDAILAQIAKGR